MKTIYLDHAATTPLRPEVLDVMLPWLKEYYGNASSLHRFGRTARAMIDEARHKLAACLDCQANELIFTSGGTESDNAAIFGAAAWVMAESRKQGASRNVSPGHIITTRIEHHAVLEAVLRLEEQGVSVTWLPVDRYGQVQVEDVAKAIRPDTFLASIMMANNEVGTIQPIREIGGLLQSAKVLFHVDAVQALGSLPISLTALPVDMMSFSAHKIGGPKGIGALYVSSRVRRWKPLLLGGSQEKARRAGTENTAAIAGFAKALDIATKDVFRKQPFMEKLRLLMITALSDGLTRSGVVVNGHPTDRLAHILNVSFPGADTESLLMNADLAGLAIASGSACSSGSHERSHVLGAMGLSEDVMNSAVRISFGVDNTAEETIDAANRLMTIVRRLGGRSEHS
jgi:cysteine desulfurase